MVLSLVAGLFSSGFGAEAAEASKLERIRISEDGRHFVFADSGKVFRPWGVNYDHNENTGGLIEDYWADQWEVIVEDFDEIVDLGANVIRIHLQTGRFMEAPDRTNAANLERLSKLLALAEEKGLYLDITGLGCYHKHDVPEWFNALDEAERWEVQARFWEAIAKTCRGSPAVFCYDLMNEPVMAGKDKVETEWVTGELAGKSFVQRLTLDLAGREREEVAKAWVDRLTAAIRKQDQGHLITVGVIPWVFHFGAGKPFFYSESVGESLDFVAVHFYPKAGEVDKAVAAIQAYDIGKPIVVEETFPLRCSADELVQFMEETDDIVDGWISFYWGKTAEEYGAMEEPTIADALKKGWLERFRGLSVGR